jgi:hypothetical protein
VRPNRRYRLTASRPGYRTVERTVDIGESDDTIELTLALDDE